MIRDGLGTIRSVDSTDVAVESQDDADRACRPKAAARCWNAAGHIDLIFASHEVVRPPHVFVGLSRFSTLRQGDEVLPG
jgi:hypothetical protein